MTAHFRAYPRAQSRTSAALRVDEREARVLLVDLGMGGAGIELVAPFAVERELRVGEQVDLVLGAANRWEPLVLSARLAWWRPPRAGLAFLHDVEPSTWALFELLGTESFER
jgi:hypothetical protein